MIDLDKFCIELIGLNNGNAGTRREGNDWPETELSMIGQVRMMNIKELAEDIIQNNIEGDFIETGVWRGGACIFMAAILKNHNIKDRNIWVCDSFEGLPKPNSEKYPSDAGDNHHTFSQLAIPMEQVQENFKTHDLLSDQIKFVKGWFKDTLPTLPAKKFSLLRLDGDMYESTMDALVNLYPKLSVGGYVIIDDYGLIPCKTAVTHYCQKNNIDCEIIKIDGSGAYWKKVAP